MINIKINNLFLLLLFFVGLLNNISSSLLDKRPRTIFIIGDSTAANKDISKGQVERGWGMVFQENFNKDKIIIDNHALNGRSSKSFRDEGEWDKILSKIKLGDYVIIQFGHNDEKDDESRHTDVGSTFDYNLERYCNETRALGGIPILMNCVARRNFAKSENKIIDDEALRNTTYADGGKVEETDILVYTHGDYRLAPINVARKLNVFFVDANKITHRLEQGLGVEGSKKLHMWFLPGEEKSEPKGKQDNTHYNIYGAKTVAKLLADAICEEIPELKQYRIIPDSEN